MRRWGGFRGVVNTSYHLLPPCYRFDTHHICRRYRSRANYLPRRGKGGPDRRGLRVASVFPRAAMNEAADRYLGRPAIFVPEAFKRPSKGVFRREQRERERERVKEERGR